MTTAARGAEGRSRHVPIEDHGIIGDLHTAALVTTGRRHRLAVPAAVRLAVACSPRCWTRTAAAGSRSAAPVPRGPSRCTCPDSNILLTRFLGESSVGEVVDFMVPHEHGRAGGAAHQLVRLVRAVRGRVEVDIRCEPAFDYGRARTEVDIVEGAGAFFSSPAGQLVLRSTVSLVADGGAGGGGAAAVARPVLEEGETLALSLSRRGSPRPLDMVEVDALLATTLSYWQRWVRRSRYSGRYREMVERSALTLKLLVHQPTGALVAAPTTSLPEAIGGTRNWDYRFTWVRDAAFTVYALMRLGFTDEAAAFMSWLEARCREAPAEHGLQILYSIDGGPAPPELTLEHLSGYRGSRPVRIGNGAADQLPAGHLRRVHGLGLPLQQVRRADLLRPVGGPRPSAGLAREALGGGRRGVWEVRGPRQRFTYSSLMTWVAFERAGRHRPAAGAAGTAGRVAPGRRPRLPARAGVRLEPPAPGLRAAPRQHHPRRRRAGHAAGQVLRPERPAVPVHPRADRARSW